MDGADGGGKNSRSHSKTGTLDETIDSMAVSKSSGGTQRQSAHRNKYCGEFIGIGLGGNSGRIESNGRIGKTSDKREEAISCGNRRDVHFFGIKHFLPAIDSGNHHCISKSVWRAESVSSRAPGNYCNVREYRSGDFVL